MNDAISEFTSIFNRIAHSKSESQVFEDFLDIVICAFSGEKYEEEYLSIVGKYKREEVELFSKLLAVMILGMDNEGQGLKDVLGEFFQLHITHGRNGQFFTPEHVCDFMAGISIEKETIGKTVMDPACGSGRMLLSAAKISRHNLFFAADLDSRCAKMTAINMCLNALVGEVAHMNSLSLEHWGAYQIFLDRDRLNVPTIRKLNSGEGMLYQNRENIPKPSPTGKRSAITVTQTKLEL